MDYLYSLQTLRESLPSFINYFFIMISEFVTFFGPILGACIYWGINKKDGAWMVFNIAGADTLTNSIKLTACVYRPWILDSRIYPAKEVIGSATGYSFPSGHTTAATSTYGSIALLKKKNKVIIAICIILILLTAFARNWLGCHTFYDVFTALITTSIFLFISSKIKNLLDTHPEYDKYLFMIIVALLLFVSLFLLLKSYPMDYDESGTLIVDPHVMSKDGFGAIGMLFGTVLGWLWERKLIHFDIEGTKSTKIIRCTIGVIIFALLYTVILKKLFGGLNGNIYMFLRRFLSFLFITGIYPFFIKLIQNKRKN